MGFGQIKLYNIIIITVVIIIGFTLYKYSIITLRTISEAIYRRCCQHCASARTVFLELVVRCVSLLVACETSAPAVVQKHMVK